MKIATEEEFEKYYLFLDKLQESGATNMFGAAPYLEREFGVSRGEAKDILLSWMKTYESRHK